VSKPLIIVESPAKARTIAGFLGADYDVASSVGHVRDLPRTAKEIPAKYKGEAWAKDWGIDIENGFAPLYIVTPDKKDVIKELKAKVANASELYLATDEDREGEVGAPAGHGVARARQQRRAESREEEEGLVPAHQRRTPGR